MLIGTQSGILCMTQFEHGQLQTKRGLCQHKQHPRSLFSNVAAANAEAVPSNMAANSNKAADSHMAILPFRY